jgi:hypothetical protein
VNCMSRGPGCIRRPIAQSLGRDGSYLYDLRDMGARTYLITLRVPPFLTCMRGRRSTLGSSACLELTIPSWLRSCSIATSVVPALSAMATCIRHSTLSDWPLARECNQLARWSIYRDGLQVVATLVVGSDVSSLGQGNASTRCGRCKMLDVILRGEQAVPRGRFSAQALLMSLFILGRHRAGCGSLPASRVRRWCLPHCNTTQIVSYPCPCARRAGSYADPPKSSIAITKIRLLYGGAFQKSFPTPLVSARSNSRDNRPDSSSITCPFSLLSSLSTNLALFCV